MNNTFLKGIFASIIVLMNLSMANLLIANPYSNDCSIYQAYISGDISMWEDAMLDLEQQYLAYSGDKTFINNGSEKGDNSSASGLSQSGHQYKSEEELLKTLLFAQYGYIGYKIGVNKDDEASAILDKAWKYLNKLMENDPGDSELLALKGAFYGFEIGLNKSKAIYLGPKSMKYIERAIKADNKNATAWIEKGNAKYFMPPVFGGSVEEAIVLYEKAINLFEQKDAFSGCNWLYVNTLVRMGRMYADNNQKQEALAIYKKALKREPFFDWVKHDLIPDVHVR